MKDDVGKLILRLTLGILILFHGVSKLKTGVAALMPAVQGLGLPTWFTYAVYLGEVVGPILLIIGLFARTGATLIFINMIFAFVLVHRPDLFTIGKQGAGRSSCKECIYSRRSHWSSSVPGATPSAADSDARGTANAAGLIQRGGSRCIVRVTGAATSSAG